MNQNVTNRRIVSIDDIGKTVKTPYGIGILVYIDAGGAYWVEFDNDEQEQIRDPQEISLVVT